MSSKASARWMNEWGSAKNTRCLVLLVVVAWMRERVKGNSLKFHFSFPSSAQLLFNRRIISRSPYQQSAFFLELMIFKYRDRTDSNEITNSSFCELSSRLYTHTHTSGFQVSWALCGKIPPPCAKMLTWPRSNRWFYLPALTFVLSLLLFCRRKTKKRRAKKSFPKVLK